MYKKILILTFFCFMFITSFVFGETTERTLPLFLGETINLSNYFNDSNIPITLNENTLIQNGDSHILTVDVDFSIHAKTVGETLLVFVNKNTLSTLKVKVLSPIKSVDIKENNLTLRVGEIYPLNYTIIPNDNYDKPINQKLKWTIKPSNIVGISGDNRLHTYGVGTAILTGTTYDNSHTIQIKVTVLGNPYSLTIQPETNNKIIKVGEKAQLHAFFDTKDVTKFVTWTSQYPDILTVDQNGLVSPLKAGTCEVTAQSSLNYKKNTYTFIVQSMIKDISLNKNNIIIDSIGEQEQLEAKLTYLTSDIKPLLDGYYYTTSNNKIATVTDEGLITATGKGTALISVISKDSGKQDHCTVEVIGETAPTTNDTILIKDISLTTPKSEVIIGEKLPLAIAITPENASENSFKFDIKNGDISQIHQIDNHYYFIPQKRGSVTIKVAAKNGLEDVFDTVLLKVRSPIASLNLSLITNDGEEREDKLYVGEQAQLLTEILTHGQYSSFDVYPNTLVYSVDDPDILKLDYLNGHYYLMPLQKGTTTIRVENIEERHESSLKIRVLNPVSKSSTDPAVKLPLNTFYRPSFEYVAIPSAKNISTLNVLENISLDVEEFYLSQTYVENEIKYEHDIISTFKRGPSSPTTKATIKKHEVRLRTLEQLNKTATKGYCLVSTPFFKNRNFNNYTYYEIKDNKIIGYYPGKAVVKVTVKGSSRSALTTLYWIDNPELFSIKSKNEWLDLPAILAQNNLEDAFALLSKEQQVQHLIYYLSNKHLFESQPTIDLVSSLMKIDYTQLPRSIFTNYQEAVTVEELGYIAMYLDNQYLLSQPPSTKNIVYYDLVNEPIKEALAKGYIQPYSSNYFKGERTAEYQTFKAIVDKLIPNHSLPEKLHGKFTHEQLLLMLGNL